MSLSSEAEELYEVAKNALPRWLFEPGPVAPLRAAAQVLGDAWRRIKDWTAQTYYLGADTLHLDAHAKDRGTRRQLSENNAALADRLRKVQDAVTKPALLAGVNAILAAAGVVGTAGIVELRYDRAYFGTYAATGRSKSYLSRGERMGYDGSLGHRIIVILPYGTTAGTAAAITEYLRMYIAAGIYRYVEVRGVP